ncbi:hypothetical protein N656DRAFT_304227 [Canariomyces notabilis]|uniref:Uncharacterized protein n=1 Tax=Canariomyces notabilis TaxID=2074819 RepID=A0AAN6TAL2_9PEZI|nr:hypothetical protein N656DRAFT_304227 [Canariomyces arenarius]
MPSQHLRVSFLFLEQSFAIIQIRIQNPLIYLSRHQGRQLPGARIGRLVRRAVIMHLVLRVGVVQHPQIAALGRLNHLEPEQAAALLAGPVRRRLAPPLRLGPEQHRLVHRRSVVPRFPAPEARPPHLALARHLCPRDAHAVAPGQRPPVQLLLHGCARRDGVALRRRLQRCGGYGARDGAVVASGVGDSLLQSMRLMRRGWCDRPRLGRAWDGGGGSGGGRGGGRGRGRGRGGQASGRSARAQVGDL